MAHRIDPRRDSRIVHGHRTRAAVIIRKLDAISRTRALTNQESDRLYQAIRDERRQLVSIKRAKRSTAKSSPIYPQAKPLANNNNPQNMCAEKFTTLF